LIKINILGVEYDYNVTTEKQDIKLCDKNGYCDSFAKIISIESDYNIDNPNAVGKHDDFEKYVKRHEIIHAFFHESGLIIYEENEMLTDWIAIQFENILKVFKEVGAI